MRMARNPSTTLTCTECGWTTGRWVGRCQQCQAWGSLSDAAPRAGVLPSSRPSQAATRITEVAATDVAGMLAEGAKLAGVAPNVVVKLPLTREGLIATAEFAVQGIQTNVTLCFSAAQALLAAKAGASYISPFIGRLDDYGADGMDLISEIRAIYDNYDFDTEILAASIRTPSHVTAAALAGADCATIPPTVFADLFKHPLTEKGLEQFMSDWAKTGQSIL